METNQDEIQRFGEELESFTEQFKDTVRVIDQVNLLICQAVSMSCCCAPGGSS